MIRRPRLIALELRLFGLFFLMALSSSGNAAAADFPRRIVSLAPSVTETVFALGFGNRLVGVTARCDYPAEAKSLPKVGDFMSPSLEVIAAKQPDLVIGVAGATDPAKAREIERLGIKITLVSVSSVNQILSSFKRIAGLLGDPDAGVGLVETITSQFDRVKKRVAPALRRSTLLTVGLRPLVAVGGKNFLDELITLAGGANIAGDASQPWLNLPDEYVLAKAPQVIIEAGMGSDAAALAKHWSDLKSIPAVKQRRVYSYSSDKILRPGPRIGEGLEEIARLIHPECFDHANSAKGTRCEGARS
ncbi:MAG TPA: helical backbone metal receptor [Candidatus Binatia bacterium]|jgi:iron complex transport system substrate-binding protein|nr:helical backbone metal receptor [Candidatus Binatia bacterium]